MIGKLTPDDPKPNSDQIVCQNCDTIVDEKMITETIDGEPGCTECISKCGWCGHYYFSQDMYDNPYLGYTCGACLHCEDYMKAAKDEVLKDALRGLFDISGKGYEDLIITIAFQLGYYELADELRNDK